MGNGIIVIIVKTIKKMITLSSWLILIANTVMTPDGDNDDVGIGDVNPPRRVRWEDECNGDPDMGMRCTLNPPKKTRYKE